MSDRRQNDRTGAAWFEPLIDRHLLPEPLLRAAVRRRLAARVRQLERGGPAAQAARRRRLLDLLQAAPIAAATDRANEQHYELPPAFFELFLGPRLKYSACLWERPKPSAAASPPGDDDGLSAAEDAMLALTCSRAALRDGMRVLDLGCGWGSLSLWIAEHYPACRITAVSNSRDQGAFIRERARVRGFHGIEVHTADVATFQPSGRFDRVVSIEMLEHVRNYPAALSRIAGWLEPDGAFFAHVFAHRRFAYLFDEADRGDWMARHFFAGGTMPAHDLLPSVAAALAEAETAPLPDSDRRPSATLKAVADWWVPGTHYAATLEAWRARYDAARGRIMPILADVYGPEAAAAWHARWRLFFISCAETFAFRGGDEWGVSHHLFRLHDRGGACEP